MTKKKAEKVNLEEVFSHIGGVVREENFKDFLESNYLPMAHYSIQDRALVREDGLKPVQRRLIWSMYKSKLFSSGKTLKAAKVYSSVAGDYHPHGPASVSQAGARLAQDFATRLTPIDVQGTIGVEFGDKETADRYYEIKLSRAGELLVEDSKYNVSTMIPNYTNELEIPVQLPTRWPFNIINGGQGMAIGYATKMAPHNPTEVMNAVIERVKGNLKTTKKLMSIMKGPDLPTGAKVLGTDGIKEYYETGKGSFIIRATYYVEDLSRGRHIIHFTEIPYQVSPTKIIEEINNLKAKAKKIREDKKANLSEKDKEILLYDDVTEVKNLYDMDFGADLTVSLKAGANPQILLESLFKKTSLQISFSVNNTVITEGFPKVVNMMYLIDSFIGLREECFSRKVNNKIKELDLSYKKNYGLKHIIDVDIDKAISIIRKSDNADVAKEKLIKAFKVSPEAADYVLAMRLQQLTKQDSKALAEKIKKLKEELDKLNVIISSDEEFKKGLIAELQETKKIIASPRRTEIIDVSSEELDKKDKEKQKAKKLLEKGTDVHNIILADNTILKAFDTDIDSKIPIAYSIKSSSQDNLFALMKNGSLVEIDKDSIILDTPSTLKSIGINTDKLSLIIPQELKDNQKLLVVTNYGNVNIYKNIKDPLVKFTIGEELVFAKIIDDTYKDKDILILANDGLLAKFPISKIRESNGGAGVVAGMKLVGNLVSSATIAEDVIVTVGEKTVKLTENSEIPSTNRNVKGSMLHKPMDNEKLIHIYSGINPVVLNKKNLKPIKLPRVSDRAGKGEAYKKQEMIFTEKN